MSTITTTRPVPDDFMPRALRDVLARRRAGAAPQVETVDGFPVYGDDPLRESHLLLDAYAREAAATVTTRMHRGRDVAPTKFATGRAVLDAPAEARAAHARAIVARVLFFWEVGAEQVVDESIGPCWRIDDADESRGTLEPLAAELLRRDVRATDDLLFDWVDGLTTGGEVGTDLEAYMPARALAELARQRSALPPACVAGLRRLRDRRRQHPYGRPRDEQELITLLDELLGEAPPQRKAIAGASEPWADAANAFLASLDGERKKAWKRLIDTARKAPGSSPSGKWLKGARELVEAVGADEFKKTLCEWMLLACKGVMVPDPMNGQTQIESGLDVKNADVLKGLVWAAGSLDDPSLSAPIGDFAEQCYKKLRWVGPRSSKVGNACVAALAAMTGEAPAAQLTRLKQRVKQPSGKKMTGKALERFAGRAGMTVDDVEDRSIPVHGLGKDATRSDTVGDFTARLAITGSDVAVTWQGPDGKPRATPPASLKQSHAAKLKELAALHKQVKTDLSAHRDRIERMYLDDRVVPYATWRSCYLDHPLVGTLARRLVWTVGDAPVLPDGDRLRDAAGKIVRPPPDDAPVRLWHPAGRSTGDVLAWRNRLAEVGVTQPFKQAHREVYLLTDAERRTSTYSNRFAAHLLRQHQFAALCTQRGWRYRLMGSWDPGDESQPMLALPKWKLRAEYWLEYAVGGATDTGVSQLVSTDQVRFYRADSARPMALEKVPPLVFSEVMRDVDLFVGVASVGNDPQWLPEGDRVGNYWHQYTFGDLGATAETRRTVLETLLPRLKIRDRASLADRFLVIRGNRRTYKIHLGSGNILMEPNDQYLCIVPDRSRATRTGDGDGNVFLPFEGDATLSVILSKAFMLADDMAITDPTIVSQIR